MKYKGKLYGKVAGKYIEVDMTAEQADQLRSDRDELLQALKNITVGITYTGNKYDKEYDKAVELIIRIEKERE